MEAARLHFDSDRPRFDRAVQLWEESQALCQRLWAIVGPDPIIAQLKHAPEPPDGPDESQE